MISCVGTGESKAVVSLMAEWLSKTERSFCQLLVMLKIINGNLLAHKYLYSK